MNYRVERIRSRPGRLREIGDRLTGGGVRALLQRLLRRVRDTGDRLTGGGLRSLSARMAARSLRIAMSQPFLKALGRSVLQPFPSFSARVYRLATTPDTMATTADTVATTSIGLPQHRDHSLLVNSLYKTAFGRIADPDGLANCSHQLHQGVSLEVLAEQIVASVEFSTTHGSERRLDMKYVTSPAAELFHLECASHGLDLDPARSGRFLRDQQHMHTACGSLMESADPFHNPNLRVAGYYFEIPSSPRREKPWRSVFEQVFNLKQRFGLARGVA